VACVVSRVRAVIFTAGAWVALGCGYREVAPPAAPAQAVPAIEEPPTAAPAEGSSRITFDVEGERASVYRQVEMAQPAERQVTRSRNAPAAYDRYELLCVTPCVADLRQGAHVVRFESMTDRERTSEAMVLAPKQPTIVRHALGRKESISTGYIAFTFLTASGIIFATFSGVSGLATLAGDRWRTEDGKRYDAHAEARSELIFAGISGAVSVVGALGMILTRPDWQNGSSIQFQQP